MEEKEGRRGEVGKRKFIEVFRKDRDGVAIERMTRIRLFPSYLDGTLAGDAQFDPLRLSNTKEKMRRNVELELLHGRWAMLAVVPLAASRAVLSRGGRWIERTDLVESWRESFGRHRRGTTERGISRERIASRIIGIAFCQAVLMGGPEYASSSHGYHHRLVPVGVYLPGDLNYPGGGPFDPFNLSADAERDVEWRVAEVKHGRLAMIAMLGVFAKRRREKDRSSNVLEFF